MQKTTIIAEVGSSHLGSFNNAITLIDAAANAGADYAKFQLFGGDDLWSKDSPNYEVTKKLALPEEWIPDLMARCFGQHIGFLCTPFSPRAVEVLEQNKVFAYKVASGDITYTPLLESIAKTGKRVFLSVGASDFKEIDAALQILKLNDVVIMHCIPEYPSTPANYNIRRILDLTERYTMSKAKTIPIGISSHLREWWVDASTVLYRAFAIEKHLSLEGRPGVEGPHSLDPDEFAMFVAAVRDLELSMEKHDEYSKGELEARNTLRRNPSDWLRPYARPA